MRNFVASSALFALFSLEAQATLYGRSLTDCQAFALLFDNTCDTVVDEVQNYTEKLTDFANHAGATMQCTGTDIACPSNDSSTESVDKADYDTDNYCEYTRKLCVSCSQASDDADVYISVQTNNLPSHCTNSSLGFHISSDEEWMVKWNTDMTGIENYTDDDFSSSDATDEILCDISRTVSDNMPTEVDFTCESCEDDSGTNYNDTASGIALSGGYIFNALAGGDVDAVINEIETLSVCFDHPTPDNQFHYHYWTPCAKAGYGLHSSSVCPDLCADTEECVDLDTAANFAMTSVTDSQDSYFQGSTWDAPIGLAKDGHILFGPYKDTDANTWQCDDRDVCNGTTLTTDAGEDIYVYVGSETFPYNLGCFGPGPAVNYAPTCTSNGCGEETETEDGDDDDDCEGPSCEESEDGDDDDDCEGPECSDDDEDDEEDDEEDDDDDEEEAPDSATTMAATATAAIVISASLF